MLDYIWPTKQSVALKISDIRWTTHHIVLDLAPIERGIARESFFMKSHGFQTLKSLSERNSKDFHRREDWKISVEISEKNNM